MDFCLVGATKEEKAATSDLLDLLGEAEVLSGGEYWVFAIVIIGCLFFLLAHFTVPLFVLTLSVGGSVLLAFERFFHGPRSRRLKARFNEFFETNVYATQALARITGWDAMSQMFTKEYLP